MFADEIRRAIEASSRIALPTVTALLWRAYGEGNVTEVEAETLSNLIEVRARSEPPSGNRPEIPGSSPGGHTDRHTPQDRQGVARKLGTGSRPRTEASMGRRRRWASSGRLPPALAARFTLAEHAVLAVVAAETARRGDCRLAVGHLAAIVGVAETTVRNAIREARRYGLLTVEERRLTGFRNDTNVLRIVSPEWTAWLRLARKGVPPRYPHGGDSLSSQRRGHHDPALREGGGCKSAKPTPTQVSTQGKTRIAGPSQGHLAVTNPTSRGTARVAGA